MRSHRGYNAARTEVWAARLFGKEPPRFASGAWILAQSGHQRRMHSPSRAISAGLVPQTWHCLSDFKRCNPVHLVCNWLPVFSVENQTAPDYEQMIVEQPANLSELAVATKPSFAMIKMQI